MKKILTATFIACLLLGQAVVNAQNSKLSKAYEEFEAKEYYKAIDDFKDAYQKITDKEEKAKIIFHVAECYRITNNPRQAALWYNKALKKDFDDPIAILRYADMLKMLEEYEDAQAQYEAYYEIMPSDARGKDGIESCKLAQEWKEYPSGYTVEEMKFFNSKSNDFSPSYAREDFRMVYFTSTRDETLGKAEHGATGQGFADIFESTIDRKGAWSTPVPLGEEINTEFEEGTPSLSADFNRMYFTRCQFSKKKIQGCAIMVAERKGDSWDKPESLNLLPDSLVAAHPAISADELTLYFVSDIDGSIKDAKGKNSKDIWRVTRSSISDNWSEPEHLGDPINTPGNEVFPYLHYDGSLYFSSDYHIGMGGLDIFKATPQADGSWTIENLKYPVNSSSDDFGICFEHEREAGFFTSTRKGKSDDIYAFLLPPLKFSISGIVRNEKTDAPIANAIVKSIGSDGITIEATTQADGRFKFMLQSATDYVFIAKHDEFLQGKERETTKGRESSTELTSTIYLAPIDKPIEIENIFFDFNSADLRPESMVSLDELVETLIDNPNIVIELGSHTDERASEEYNLNLSGQRAQSVVDYLVSKGIAADRLIAKGYGESTPKTVSKRDHDAYPFLPEGQVLTEEFINTIKDDDLQETAHFLNRRTEFQVLRTDYK